MDILERAEKLYQEANQILKRIRLETILRPGGEITYTGSYFLNLMVYPDVDIYIPPVSIDQMFRFGVQFARMDAVTQVNFEKSDIPSLPDGLYMKIRVQQGDWERPWKVDIWSVSETVIAEKLEPMQRYKDKLTPALREKIIRYKASIINHAKRTPMYSGYFIYKAFFEEGLEDPKDVTAYLLKNGIDFDSTGRD